MPQPHIVLYVSDQHSPRFLGHAGDPHVRTPALDRMAEEGTRFDACYCDNPLCVPSRMAMMTGRHGHRLGIWGNTGALGSNVPTVAHAMGLAGYRTVLAGRMHFIGADQHHGFQERPIGDITSGFLGENRTEHRHRGFWGEDGVRNPGAARSLDLAYDTAVACEAQRVIYEHEASGDERPLFLVVGFYSPHDPYVMPADRLEPYLESPDDAIDPEPADPHPFTARKQQPLPRETRRRARAAYRAKTQFLDERIGEIEDAWRESPLSEDGLSIYVSDHGEMAGNHGLWTKGSFYDDSARVPMIVRGPGRVPAGQRVAQPVSLIDLAPTLIEAGEGPALPQSDGISLWGLATGTRSDGPSHALSEHGPSKQGGPARMVREGPWKYVWYEGAPPELYHLESDPDEMQNLAGAEAHAETERQLHARLFADGWDPAEVRAIQEREGPDRAFIGRYGKALQPRDPHQWGRPSPL